VIPSFRTGRSVVKELSWLSNAWSGRGWRGTAHRLGPRQEPLGHPISGTETKDNGDLACTVLHTTCARLLHSLLTVIASEAKQSPAAESGLASSLPFLATTHLATALEPAASRLDEVIIAWCLPQVNHRPCPLIRCPSVAATAGPPLNGIGHSLHDSRPCATMGSHHSRQSFMARSVRDLVDYVRLPLAAPQFRSYHWEEERR
jgi:hypothetical protein